MARKFPFKFNFDEDADPVEELHRLRVAAARHFKTVDAIMDYCNTLPSPAETLAELKEEIAAKQARSGKVKAAKLTSRRKSAKRPVHAR